MIKLLKDPILNAEYCSSKLLVFWLWVSNNYDILQALLEGQLELLRYFKQTHIGTQSKVTVTLDDFAKRLGTFTYDTDSDLPFDQLVNESKGRLHQHI